MRANEPIPVGPLPTSRRKNKYNVSAKPDRTLDGRVYASKAEMQRAAHWASNCVIQPGRFLVAEQPVFLLGCALNVYKADFIIIDKSDPAMRWVEEVKGKPTAKFRRDVKLWRQYGPCPLYILTYANKSWHTEIITGVPNAQH